MKLCVFAFLAAVCVASPMRWYHVHENVTFEDYATAHNKVYDEVEVAFRRALFEVSKAKVLKHNAEGHSYKVTLNRFSDRTTEELKATLGGKNSAFFPFESKFQQPFEALPAQDLPTAVDWRSEGIVTSVKNQNQCGSCWAFATTETIESHVGLSNEYHSPPVLIVSCVPNTNDCGGTGGCQGGIPEIAYDYLASMGGMAEEWLMPYESAWGTTGKCTFHSGTASGDTTPIATVGGFVKLPKNNETAVMEAVAFKGPLAVNVAAMDWHSYDSGVYTGCLSTSSDTFDIDHVVQMVGYGTDATTGLDYFTIRNSWSPTWGEGGFIRLVRHTDNPICGDDLAPKDGTGCNNSPSKVEVCGCNGVVYDASYPTGARFL